MTADKVPAEADDGAGAIRALMDVAASGRDLGKALKLAEQRAEGCPAARYLYGLFLYTGTGIQQDRAAAAECFQLAAGAGCADAAAVTEELARNDQATMDRLLLLRFRGEQRDTAACRELFALYDTGKENGKPGPAKKDHASAVRWYTVCADDGDADAMNTVGYMYLMGKGIDKDKEKAVRYLKDAFEHGSAQAAFRLAQLYDNGECYTDPDLDRAVDWYQKSADLGYADAEYALAGVLLMQDSKYFNVKRALTWLAKAADQGHHESEHQLGLMYAYGSNGLRRSPPKAIKLLTAACEGGNQQAMVDYANLCFEGQALPQDLAAAAKWFQEAAKTYSGVAEYALGCMYGNGYYFKKDAKESAKWFQEAAEGGEPNSQYALGCYYYEGRGVAKDDHEALVWFQEAAEQGHPGAMAFLGMFKVTGKAIDQDVEGGLKLLNTAADNGYPEAQYYLGKLYKEGIYVAKDMQKARKLLTLAAKQGDPDAAALLDEIKQNRLQ